MPSSENVSLQQAVLEFRSHFLVGVANRYLDPVIEIVFFREDGAVGVGLCLMIARSGNGNKRSLAQC